MQQHSATRDKQSYNNMHVGEVNISNKLLSFSG